MKSAAPLTITGGLLVLPEGAPAKGAIRCEGDRIVALGADVVPQPGDRVVEAKGKRIPVQVHAPTCTAAVAYREIAERIVARRQAA